MAQAMYLDLQIQAARRAHLAFIFYFSIEIHKLEVAPKLWDSTMEIRKSPDG
jgi:hypothetical protein